MTQQRSSGTLRPNIIHDRNPHLRGNRTPTASTAQRQPDDPPATPPPPPSAARPHLPAPYHARTTVAAHGPASPHAATLTVAARRRTPSRARPDTRPPPTLQPFSRRNLLVTRILTLPQLQRPATSSKPAHPPLRDARP